jgi:hypothetical protein
LTPVKRASVIGDDGAAKLLPGSKPP